MLTPETWLCDDVFAITGGDAASVDSQSCWVSEVAESNLNLKGFKDLTIFSYSIAKALC